MLVHERRGFVEINWTAILSYAGSLAVSLAVWAGVIRAVQHFMK
jgi:hypothetical protein